MTYETGLSQTDINRFWELSNLEHLRRTHTGTAVVWVDDAPNKRTLQECEDPAFVFSARPSELGTLLNDLAFLSQEAVPGRLRIAINSKETDAVLAILDASPFAGGRSADVLINSEVIAPQRLVQESISRPNLMYSLDVVGLINFVKMATVLWVGPLTPATETNIKSRGVVVLRAENDVEAYSILADRPFLQPSRYVRLVVSQPSILQQEPSKFVQTVRARLLFKCPIIFRVENRSGFDELVYQYPFVRVTSDAEEILACAAMGDIDWARSAMLSWSGRPEVFPSASLTIHSIRCSNLYPMDVNGLSDPFVIMYLKGQRVEKTKITKETLFPVWEDLNWTFDVSSMDSMRMEVYDYDRVGGNDFEGLVRWQHIYELAPISCHRWEFTTALTSRTASEERDSIDRDIPQKKEKNKKTKKEKKSVVTGSLSVVYSFNPRPFDFVAKHFGRPLAESLDRALEEERVHVTHKIFYTFTSNPSSMQTEGIFRDSGNSVNVKGLALQIDTGNDLRLDSHPLNDVCSLLKYYYSELPDKLLPHSLYSDFKLIAAERSVEDRSSGVRKLVFESFPPHHAVLFS